MESYKTFNMKTEYNKMKRKLFYFIVLFIIFSFLYTKYCDHLRSAASGKNIACLSHLNNIGRALDEYYEDHKKTYPDSLKKLTPKYLKSIPTCPTVKRDTYSNTYTVSTDKKHYTFFCRGNNHSEIGENKGNWPQYNSREGIKHPFDSD